MFKEEDDDGSINGEDMTEFELTSVIDEAISSSKNETLKELWRMAKLNVGKVQDETVYSRLGMLFTTLSDVSAFILEESLDNLEDVRYQQAVYDSLYLMRLAASMKEPAGKLIELPNNVREMILRACDVPEEKLGDDGIRIKSITANEIEGIDLEGNYENNTDSSDEN